MAFKFAETETLIFDRKIDSAHKYPSLIGQSLNINFEKSCENGTHVNKNIEIGLEKIDLTENL